MTANELGGDKISDALGPKSSKTTAASTGRVRVCYEVSLTLAIGEMEEINEENKADR
jgi:hypothetical protein